mgnify:CR=1 FL=1
MENVDIEDSETGSDNNRGDNEDGEEPSGQLKVDIGQVRKVRPQLYKKSHMGHFDLLKDWDPIENLQMIS